MTELYQVKHSLDFRIDKANRIKQKHPERIPIVLQKAVKSNSDVPNKTIFALSLPTETIRIMKQFLRNKLMVSSNEELFLFSNHRFLQQDTTIKVIYDKQNSPDGMLYLDYTGWEWSG